MTTKKGILAACLLLVLSCLASCASEIPKSNQDSPNIVKKEPTYEIFEVGAYDYISDAMHSYEMDLDSTKDFIDTEKEGTTRTFVTPLGETVTATYGETEIKNHYQGTREEYSYRWDKGFIDIGWNPDKNQMDSYVNMLYDDQYDPSRPHKTGQDCLSLAKQYLEAFSGDGSDQYVLTDSLFYDYPAMYQNTTMNPAYTFVFERQIDGMFTTDHVIMDVDVYGKLVMFHSFEFCNFKGGAQVPDDETITLIEGKMDEKLAKIYEPYADEYTVKYEWDRKHIRLKKMADGRLGLKYSVSVDVLDDKGASVLQYGAETVVLFVYLEA